MRRQLLLLLTLLLSVLSTASTNDNYSYRNITMSEGLPSNAVRHIVQDAYGFIWLGTDNGLCRYDGTSVQLYRIPELGINQYITALLTTDSALYVGTEKGVYVNRLDQQQQFVRLPLDIHSMITSLALDNDGQLWAATLSQGVWCYSPQAITHYDDFSANGGCVQQLLIDSSNQIWAVSNQGRHAVMQLNRLHNHFEPVMLQYPEGYWSLTMLQTRDGRLWLGSWEQGLLLIHNDGKLEQVLSPNGAHPCNHIHTLFERTDGNICIGCDDGVVVYNPKTHERHSYNLRFVYAITNDEEGGLWIGSFYNGVRYVSPVGRRFDVFSAAENTAGMRGNVISRFAEDGEGRIWVASDDGGLMCLSKSPSGCQFVPYPHQERLQRLNAHALKMNGDDLWIGTYTDGVYVPNTVSGQLRHYDALDPKTGLRDNSSYAIHHDRKGRTWVATMEGLVRYNPSTDSFSHIIGIAAVTIDIDEDREGRLWLSTQGAGL